MHASCLCLCVGPVGSSSRAVLTLALQTLHLLYIEHLVLDGGKPTVRLIQSIYGEAGRTSVGRQWN